MGKKESALKVGIPIGAVYVGALASAALVTGSYAVNYFANYGVAGIFLTAFYVLFISIFFYCGFEHVRSVNAHIKGEKVYDYSSLASAMYGKYSPVFLPIYEIWQFLSMLLTGAVVIATGGELMALLLNVPFLAGAAILAAIIVVLATFGAGIIRKSSTIMTALIIVIILVLVIIVMVNKGDSFTELVKSNWVPEDAPSFGNGIWRIFTLACAGSVWSLGLGAVAQKMATKKHSVAAAISAGIGGGLIFLLSTLIVLPYCPAILSDATPIFTIVSQYLAEQMPWLPIVYFSLMFLALVSSGAPSLFIFANRFRKFFPKLERAKNQRLSYILIGIVFMVLCILLSTFGLTTIVSTFFQYLGYLAMPLGIIPLLVIWPILRKKGVFPQVYKMRKKDET